MKDDVQLVENRRLLIITPSANPDLSLVVINSARSADAGLYTCTGTNAAGSVSGMIEVDIIGCEYI